MIRTKEQRVGVLVDIQNLYHSAKAIYGKKVNFQKVLEEAVGGRILIRAIGYGISTQEGQESKFFEALEKASFEVKTKDLQIFPGGMKKGDWDVGIAVDAIKLSQSLDVVVLASGDGDYIPVVEYIQNTTGCRVEGISFLESTSHRLVERLDGFTNMSENKRRFLI
ncbi:MAG TPA: NYN domain-containing protein [Candidatus Moranbacteria bacterium]|nr:NYN domain-containing protein [Candidatus Moranbacteria bacterium]